MEVVCSTVSVGVDSSSHLIVTGRDLVDVDDEKLC